jgi:hypothetical protein
MDFEAQMEEVALTVVLRPDTDTSNIESVVDGLIGAWNNGVRQLFRRGWRPGEYSRIASANAFSTRMSPWFTREWSSTPPLPSQFCRSVLRTTYLDSGTWQATVIAGNGTFESVTLH